MRLSLIDNDASLLRIFQLGALVLACGWGIDYMLRPPRYDLYTFERLLGEALPWWGATLLTMGLMGLIGEVWVEAGRGRNHAPAIPYVCTSRNRWWPSCLAHSVLCAIYGGFAAGCYVDMLVSGYFYGARMAGGMLLLSIGHGAFAHRRHRHAS